MRTTLALTWLTLTTAGLVTTGCIDDSPPPTIATGSVWIAPLPQQIALDWQGPESCTKVWGSEDCTAPSIAFTIESVTCDNCTIGSAGVGDGTVYPDGTAVLTTGLAAGVGPIAITAVLRDTNGNTATAQTTAVGDLVTGISATCQDNFLDRNGTTWVTDTCTVARRSTINSLYITPSFMTTAHGSFVLGEYSNTVDQVGYDAGTGAGDLAPSAFPTVTPAFLGWGLVGANYFANMDRSTPATSIAVQWTVGDTTLSTTVSLPPLAP